MAFLMVLPITTLASCRQSAEDIANGPDPMRALAQPVRSQRYGPDYWRGVAERDAALWARATRFCAAPDAQYPSCASVRTVAFFRANTQPAAPATPFSFRTDSPASVRADSTAGAQDSAHAPPTR